MAALTKLLEIRLHLKQPTGEWRKNYIIKIFTKYLLKNKPRIMKTNVFEGVTPLSLII